MNEDVITVSQEEYDDLVSDVAFLRALEAAGVDNWEGYDYACEIFQENKE